MIHSQKPTGLVCGLVDAEDLYPMLDQNMSTR